MKKLLCVFLLLPLFTCVCYAESGPEQAAEDSGFYAVEQALPEEERSVSGDLRLDGSYDTEAALKRLWTRLTEEAGERLKKELGFGVKLVALALLCSLASAFTERKTLRTMIEISACCAAAMMMVGDLDGVIAQASAALNRLSDYSKAAMTAVFTAAAASGAVSSAPARYAAASLAMDVLMSAAERFILPMVRAFVALSLSRSIFDNAILRAVSRAVKWCAITSMTALTLVFGFYISITGFITGSADAMAVKTAKTVISSALPVVGGILSDSAGLVLSAASLIKNSVGVFSLVAICALCLGPFVLLGAKMLVFKAAATASDMLPGGRLSALIGDMGTAFGMLLGLVGCFGIMLFLSIFSGIRTVTA